MQRTVGTGRLNRENRLNHGSTPHPARISLPPPSRLRFPPSLPPISLLPSLPCSRPTSTRLPFRSPQAPSPFSDLPLPPPGPVSSASSPFFDLPPAPARSRLPLDSIEEANLRLSMRLDAFQSASSSELLLFMGLFDSVLLDACRARFFLKFYDSKGSNFGWNGSAF
ncbi:hypothetical protein ACLOJK_016200 [Asimina triloba]